MRASRDSHRLPIYGRCRNPSSDDAVGLRHRGQDGPVTTSATSSNPSTTAGGEGEVVDLCRDLLRIPSVNKGPGDGDEREAAEYVAAKLEEVGLETTIVESEKNRTSVLARMEGEDRSRSGLLIHGHLDVVPVDAADWTLPPF